MVYKVDSAFKKRKEESQLLAMAMADLESHLAYLETQTQDQIESTSSLNFTLSARREQIAKLGAEEKDFERNYVVSLQELFEELKIATDQSKSTLRCFNHLDTAYN